MAMNRAQFPKELEEGLNAVFGMAYDEHKTEWTDIFDTENSRKAFEEDVLLAGLGAAAVKPEGTAVVYDRGAESYVSRYVHETIALAFAITEEMVEDDLYGDKGTQYSQELARSMQYTKEVKGANILNNGFDSNFAGGDGQPLFSEDHPLWGGGVLANTLGSSGADLSESAMEELLIIISNWTDERGKNIKVMVDKLIVPTALQFVAERLLGSQFRPGVEDNDINAIYAMGAVPGGYCVNHYLTDPDAWFFKTNAPHGMKHFQRIKMSRGMEGDFETGNARYKARERYSFGWSDWRGAAGSEG